MTQHPPPRPRALPLSTAYAPLPHKPHALAADYCEEWPQDRAAFMRGYRAQFPRGQAPCERCGRTEAEVRAAGEGEMNCAHDGHNPDARGNYRFWCTRCHRANDKVHQASASAITMICEGRMVAERLDTRVADLRADVARYGLPGITPGGADLTVLLTLHRLGQATEEQLLVGMKETMPELKRESGPDLREVLRTALKRLRLRQVPVIVAGRCEGVAGPLVRYGQGLFSLRLTGPLTLPPHITSPPPSLWADADRAYRSTRQRRR